MYFILQCKAITLVHVVDQFFHKLFSHEASTKLCSAITSYRYREGVDIYVSERLRAVLRRIHLFLFQLVI